MTMFKGRVNQIHFVGIGGIGMSGIAEVLLNLGYAVSGSDLKESETTKRLQQLGGTITFGHRATNIAEANVVVISSAVKGDNPEVIEARRRLIPVIPRAEMLAELMRLKYGIAVAGSHGKTTTTSLVAAILDHAAMDPTIVIGGKVNRLGTNARVGQSDYLCAEADESDGSFLKLSPTIAVVTNIDPEHMDFYENLDALRGTFLEFVNRVPFYGLAVLCLECENIRTILPKVEKRFVTYGTNPQADYSIETIDTDGFQTSFTPIRKGIVAEPILLKLVGRHNVLNALAAVAIADELNIPYGTTKEALEHFAGVQRRFTVRGDVNGITVIDDYGHHPTEISATLMGAREGFRRRIIAVFQPHRYTRLRDQFDRFATAFYQADLVLVAPVYAAGEQPIEGFDGETIARAMIDHGHRDVIYCKHLDQIVEELKQRVRKDDLVITLGAGDIWRVGQEFVTYLETQK